MQLRAWLYALAFLSAVSSVAHAHGLFHEVTRKEAVVVTALFDDGEPVTYAQVKVYSPDGGEIEYQNGRTDRKGSFAFLPDRPGEWRIAIDGGMGHRLNTAVVVNEISEAPKVRDSGGGRPRWPGLVTGLSLIFGLCGSLMYLKAKRLSRQT
jgi:nickel transport protein